MQNDKIRPASKLSWLSASETHIAAYCSSLNENLVNIHVPIEAIVCKNLTCDIHSEEINTYHNAIVNACVAAGEKCIPRSRPHKAKAGWSELVNPYKGKSIFWKRMWIKNG